MSADDFKISDQVVNLRSLVEGRLRKAIVQGHFRAGQRLVERELCELFGVGRTSVRESLRQLEAEGLITVVPHKGPTVATIGYDDARQIYALRALLEGYAAEQFALNGAQEDVEALGRCVDRLGTAAFPFEPEAWLDALNGFYDVLMAGCSNIFMVQVVRTLHNRINVLRANSLPRAGRIKRSVSEMREILAAIEARDPARAAAACRAHIAQAEKAALNHLRAVAPE